MGKEEDLLKAAADGDVGKIERLLTPRTGLFGGSKRKKDDDKKTKVPWWMPSSHGRTATRGLCVGAQWGLTGATHSRMRRAVRKRRKRPP